VLEGAPNLLSLTANSDVAWCGPPLLRREGYLKDDFSVNEPKIVAGNSNTTKFTFFSFPSTIGGLFLPLVVN
jgi:hypothetical protein